MENLENFSDSSGSVCHLSMKISRCLESGKWLSTLDILEKGSNADQLLALSELSSFLSYANEDSLLGFPSWSYMKVLLHILEHPNVKYSSMHPKGKEDPVDVNLRVKFPFYELLSTIYKNNVTNDEKNEDKADEYVDDRYNDDKFEKNMFEDNEVVELNEDILTEEMAANKMIISATCLNTILDILPHTSRYFATRNSLGVLKKKLNEIKYIDLAERILLIFGRLSREIPITLVKNGVMVLMLQYTDFFPLSVQLNTLSSVLSMLKTLERAETFVKFVIPIIPFISDGLLKENKKLVNLICGIWKAVVEIAVRINVKDPTKGDAIMKGLVNDMSANKTLENLFQLVFSQNDRPKSNLNDCLYTISVCANCSIEVVELILKLNLLDNFSKWLNSYNGDDHLTIQFIDFAISLFSGNYTNAPLCGDSTKIMERFDYYYKHPKQFTKILGVFPPKVLVNLFELSLSQRLKDRILLLLLRIMETGSQIESVKNLLVISLPVSKIVEVICCTLRCQSTEDNCLIAIYLARCVSNLFGDSVVKTLQRHGALELLESIKIQSAELLSKELKSKLPSATLEDNCGNIYRTILEIKTHGNDLTVYEMKRRGLMELDCNIFSSKESMEHFLECILRETSFFDSEQSTASFFDLPVDYRGLMNLWVAFVKLFEWHDVFSILKKDKLYRDDIDEKKLKGEDPSRDTGMPCSISDDSPASKCENQNVTTVTDAKYSEHEGKDKYMEICLNSFCRYSPCEALPFPFSHLNKEVKIRLRMAHNQDIEDKCKIPTIAVYISPLISVSKLESYVLKFINRRYLDSGKGRSVAPKKRAKTDADSYPESENNFGYSGVELFMKGVALSPNTSIYGILCYFFSKSNDSDSGTIWSRCHFLTYKLIKGGDFDDATRLLNGRFMPIVTAVCDEIHSPIGLYTHLASFLSKNNPVKDANELFQRIKRQFYAKNDHNELYKIVNDVIFADDSTSNDDISEESGYFNGYFSGLNIKHLSDKVFEALRRVDTIFNVKKSTKKDFLLGVCLLGNENENIISNEILILLKLLVILQTLNLEVSLHHGGELMANIEASKRLTLKLLGRLGFVEESMSYKTPSWFIKLALVCPSLFSFESRRILFDFVAMGPHRLLTQFCNRYCDLLDNMAKENDLGMTDTIDELLIQSINANCTLKTSAFQELDSVVQISKLKVSCSRESLLKDAIVIMNGLANTSTSFDAIAKLEVRFNGEEGVGSGPTQEFYSLVTEELIRNNESKLFEMYNGHIYPTVICCDETFRESLPIDTFVSILSRHGHYSDKYSGDANVNVRTFEYFKLLGQICASALLDGKRLDIPFHPLFLQLCQYPDSISSHQICSLDFLSSVDRDLANSLRNLLQLNTIDDIGLYYTFNDIPLIKNGHQVKVTDKNLNGFVRDVIKMRLYDGIKLQLWAFRMGFATLIPLESLQLFTPMELSYNIFSNRLEQDQYWTQEHLQSYILPDHGYDASSQVYRDFIKVLSELTQCQRRSFLRFCTGVPILPKQGFAGLKPIMKVVRKGDNPHDLPSVMTCTNYLKLPDYKNIVQCKIKLLQAIQDGQNSFTLS